MIQISLISSQEAIHRENFVPFLEQTIDEVGAEEARTPCDDTNWHILELETK